MLTYCPVFIERVDITRESLVLTGIAWRLKGLDSEECRYVKRYIGLPLSILSVFSLNIISRLSKAVLIFNCALCSEQDECTFIKFPTDPITTLEPRNPSIREFPLVQKRWLANSKTLKSRNSR